jgi:FkbM family methyltransferase
VVKVTSGTVFNMHDFRDATMTFNYSISVIRIDMIFKLFLRKINFYWESLRLPKYKSINGKDVYLGTDIGMRKNYLNPQYFDLFNYVLDEYVEHGGIALDIGAHIGLTSIHMNNSLKFKKIFSFEPNLGSFKILNENVKEIGGIVKIFNFGIGGNNSTEEFYINKYHTGLNSLSKDCLFLNEELIKKEIVQIRRVDDLINTKVIDRPNFIKNRYSGGRI